MVKKRRKIVDFQKTKIVSTLGPASSSKEVIKELMIAGVDVFRLNFSHGEHAQKLDLINIIKSLNEELDISVGILGDLQGPKLRVGKIKGDKLELQEGDVINFVNKPCEGTLEHVYMSYQNFPSDVKSGDKVLVDDGKIVLKVLDTNGMDAVRLSVVFGGILSSNKGVNLPDTAISLPAMTEKDLRDLEFILEHDLNWVALSFVQRLSDIQQLRNIIDEQRSSIKIISKIEKPSAVENIKSIIKASDAIMVARGDLGVEVPMEKLPTIQKNIIKRCIQHAKPVIVATQMMESMMKNPSPSRAEITDVANAVLDGADAVMLSGETAVGDHPVEVVKAMNKIIYEAEKQYEPLNKRPKPDKTSPTFLSDTMCYTAARLAEDIKAVGIIGLTVSGYTAFRVSSYRVHIPIYIFCKSKNMTGTFNLVWGVRSFYYNKFSTTDETIEDLSLFLTARKLVKLGDIVVNTASMPIAKRFRTNMAKITVIE